MWSHPSPPRCNAKCFVCDKSQHALLYGKENSSFRSPFSRYKKMSKTCLGGTKLQQPSSRFDQRCKTCLAYNTDAWCADYLTVEICSPLPHSPAEPWVGLALIGEGSSARPRYQHRLCRLGCRTRSSCAAQVHRHGQNLFFSFSFLLLHNIACH